MKPLRRQDRALSPLEARELLARGEYGTLATVGADGLPYGIPLSYAYRHPAIYVHCALEGRKLDNLRHQPQVSFSVVGRTRVLPESFATEYESVVASGRAVEIEGEERLGALVLLLDKYCPDHLEAGRDYIERMDQATRVVRIEIESLTGKARKPRESGDRRESG